MKTRKNIDVQQLMNIVNISINIVLATFLVIFMTVLTAQKIAPHEYNKWLGNHPNVPILVQTREPQMTVGDSHNRVPMHIDEYYGAFYDANRDVWCYTTICWGYDFILKNEDHHTFYVWVLGTVGLSFDRTEAIGACGIRDVKGNNTYLEIGQNCSVTLDTVDPLGYIQVSYEPFPDP